MMERLLATIINANQAKSDAARKADKEEMLAEMKANMDSTQAALKSAIKEMKLNREETMACQGNMEARLEEDKPASVDTTPEVAHDQGIPSEDTEVIPVGEPRKRRRDRRNLAAVRRQKKQERNLDVGRRGKQRNLVAARRGTTRRAVVARRRTLFTKTTRSRLIVAVR
jgi:Tfp pilus assembly protein FimV